MFARGSHLAELLTRSIYAKDWLMGNEPRCPRPIVKNIIDEIKTLNERNIRKVALQFSEFLAIRLTLKLRVPLGGLPTYPGISSLPFHKRAKYKSYLPEGAKPTRSQKSGSHVGSYQPTQVSNLNIQRLFCDRIEIYAPIESTRISVTSGIIRIALRSLLEAIRLQTFSKYGLQQIQGIFNYFTFYLKLI